MRLILVSNRLPLAVVKKQDRLSFQPGAGGLVSGLKNYVDRGVIHHGIMEKTKYLWVGWPGLEIKKNQQAEISEQLRSRFNAVPVYLDEKTIDRFYHGFCNNTLWPLFHYFPQYALFEEEYWHYYKRVNELFCEQIIPHLQPDDVVWVHDYHLLLLPQLLRDRVPTAKIGFFLHIPFPSDELFRLLPRKWRRAILDGMLGADVVGFHTYDYTHHFFQSVEHTFHHEQKRDTIFLRDRSVRVDTFPMGIDVDVYRRLATSPAVLTESRRLDRTFKDLSVILSVDRLDYTKGIDNRLEGYERFLRDHPEWQKKVVLAMIVVPDRVRIERYQQMKQRLDELVGRINGEFGSLDWTPIVYQYTSLPQDKLVAYYRRSAVALVTPLRDGMNLIAKEYIAARWGKPGVLILSEMAGSAAELTDAIRINPYHREEIADALEQALAMPENEQRERMGRMQQHLRQYDLLHWAEQFLHAVQTSAIAQKKLRARSIDERLLKRILQSAHKAQRRLILLDYDGTLIPFALQPKLARPDAPLLDILRRVSEHPKNHVVLVSGRDTKTLESWFGGLPMDVAAEHGAWFRSTGGRWKKLKSISNSWKALVRPIMKRSMERLPGSFIEEKEFAMSWHYRASEPNLAAFRAAELADELQGLLAPEGLRLLKGNKVIEVMNGEINKGIVTSRVMAQTHPEFILGIGDDQTDEDLFAALPTTAISIKVGMSPSAARYSVPDQAAVLKLLEGLASV